MKLGILLAEDHVLLIFFVSSEIYPNLVLLKLFFYPFQKKLHPSIITRIDTQHFLKIYNCILCLINIFLKKRSLIISYCSSDSLCTIWPIFEISKFHKD